MIRKWIAGIELRLTPEPGIVLQSPNPVAHHFHEQPSEPAALDQQIVIQIQIGPLPEVKKKHLLLRGEPLWSIYGDENFRWIVLHPPNLPRPMWIARFDRDFMHGTIFCDDFMVRREGDQMILSDPVIYPLDQLLLMHRLAYLDGFLLHATGMIADEKGFVFAGKSGAGKSTLARKWMKTGKGIILSDDRVAIRRRPDGAYDIYGTPWPGDAGIAVNDKGLLHSVGFLSHGDKDYLVPLNRNRTLQKLLPVLSGPWYERDLSEMMLTLVTDFLKFVPAYELVFTPDFDMAETLKPLRIF